LLGQDTPKIPEEGKNYVDMYYHPGWRAGLGWFGRRWGNESKQCTKIDQNMAEGERWRVVRSYALDKGVLKNVS